MSMNQNLKKIIYTFNHKTDESKLKYSPNTGINNTIIGLEFKMRTLRYITYYTFQKRIFHVIHYNCIDS